MNDSFFTSSPAVETVLDAAQEESQGSPFQAVIVDNPVLTTVLIQRGPIGDQGEPGVNGTNGTNGINGNSFTYNQIIPASVWYVNHNLGRYPAVTVIDSANTSQECEVDYTDVNNLIIYAASAFAGVACLN